MLELYYRFAARIRSVRRLLQAIAVLAVAVFCITLVPLYRGGSYAYALGAVTILLWTLWLLSVALSFARTPPRLVPGAPLLARAKARTQRLLLWLLAGALTLLLGFVVLVTVRAAGMMLRG